MGEAGLGFEAEGLAGGKEAEGAARRRTPKAHGYHSGNTRTE